MARSKGEVDLLAMRLLAAGGIAAVLSACMGYVPGRQSHWDSKVREMCERDGGVHLLHLQRVELSQEEFARLPRAGNLVGVNLRSLAEKDEPLYIDRTESVLRDANPRVTREERIVRDFKRHQAYARIVSYVRIGGDMPSIAHHSSFRCPDERVILEKLQVIYVVQGAGR